MKFKKIAIFILIAVAIISSNSLASETAKNGKLNKPIEKKAELKLGKREKILEMIYNVFHGNSKDALNTNSEVREFIDDIGRKVMIPSNIERVAPSGPMAQLLLYTACPEKIVSLGSKLSKEQLKYLDARLNTLPITGQIYGKKSTLNKEELIKAKPQIIIDFGEAKKNIEEDLNNLQKDLNIPVVFINFNIDRAGDAYRKLGKLLKIQDKTNVLAKYCDDTMEEIANKIKMVNKLDDISVYVGLENGLSTYPKGSIHALIIEKIGAKNIADVKMISGQRGETTLEQIIAWNPDVILFNNENTFNSMGSDKLWKDIKAIEENKYYLIPSKPYNFIASPPSINTIIGIKWLGNKLYPDIYKFDMAKEVVDFYKIFYHYDLSDEEAKELLE